MRRYDWERRQKTSLDKLMKDFKRQLNEAGFLTKGSDFVFALRLVGAGEGFFQTYETVDGDLEKLEPFKLLKNFVEGQIVETVNQRVQKEIDDAVESIKYDRDELSYELDCATTRISELETELKALKEENK